MRKFLSRLLSCFLLAGILAAGLLPSAVRADEAKPDDAVMFDLSAEEWITTKSALLRLRVEASVSDQNAGTMRETMKKAVDSLVSADWRLTGLNRHEDQTGLERWSANFEARVPESHLGGLTEKAKKLSQQGMKLYVSGIDFSPTLAERQEAMGKLRIRLYQLANDQLADLNKTIEGRAWRISEIDFTGGVLRAQRLARLVAPKGLAMMEASDSMNASAPGMESMERSEKILLNARVTLSALPFTREK